MKLYKYSIITMSSTLFILALIIGGCSSTGMERSEKTSTTMEKMDNDIKVVISQLDKTGASLEALMKPNQQDISEAYEAFKENVSKMESKEEDFIKHAEEMKKRGKEYFSEWEKDGNEYKNPQIQKLSEERRDELSTIYDRIAERSIGVKEAYKVYLSDIREIQQFLSNDLTSKGIEAIAPVSLKVINDGDNLKYALSNLQIAIDKAREEMSKSSR